MHLAIRELWRLLSTSVVATGPKEPEGADFPPQKQVIAGSGNASFGEHCRLLIAKIGETFPENFWL